MNRSIRNLLAGGLGAGVALLSSCTAETTGISHFGGPGSYARYTVTFADGYAGRGYYYGPGNLSYYRYQPGVEFYQRSEDVPRRYRVNHAVPGAHHPMRSSPPPPAPYAVTFGTGYAGRGYYYGPPGLHYYDRMPGVLYFRTRAEVPESYW